MKRFQMILVAGWLLMVVIVVVLAALVLSGCGSKPKPVSTEESLKAYADQYDTWYEDAEQNIAKICQEVQGPSFEMDGLSAITCPLPSRPGTYGVVTFDKSGAVLDVFMVKADTDGILRDAMRSAGWE